MNFSFFKVFTLFCCFLSLCLYAEDDIRDNSTGIVFPSHVSFDHDGKHYDLQATGVSTRKKFFVKVYSVASYLQQGNESDGDKFQQIMQDNTAKQLTMKWAHEASAEKIQNGYRESFKNVISESEAGPLQNDMNTYINFFNQNAQKGDEHVLRWLPGGYVEVIINGQKAGSLTNPEFAKALWSLWFGSKSVVDRNSLVSLMK